jgi:ribulose 1,5-bisphosphate synthetase/thiazole synthase
MRKKKDKNVDKNIDKKYEERAHRMVNRWAGIRGPKRENHQPNEKIGIKKQHQENEPIVEFITEKPKKIPIHAKCDVLVVGGGPAGISAALAAKRAGADTILMERFGCFGGVITTVGMETIAWYRYEGCVDSEGIGIEMERRAAQMGGSIKFPYNDSECLDADFFKVVADLLIKESGIRPILHCTAVEAIMDGDKITGIITESKSGRKAIMAKRVIDCTGDADIAHFSGAEYRKTNKDEMMGITTILNAAGIDKKEFMKYIENNPATYKDWSRLWEQETDGKEDNLKSPYLDKEFEKAREQGHIPENTQNLGGSWSSISKAGEATNLNLVHMPGFDGTDVEDLTKASILGREQAMHALTALQKVVPGFQMAKLRNFGMTLGIRDTRKIIGKYNLTNEDVRNQARFKDSIGIFPEFIDGYNILILPTSGRYFQVPYGCLVPKNVDNLLVAGRCVAGDKVSHCAMRNIMACTVTGQGAGVAAAISIKRNETTQDINIESLQKELKNQKVKID